MPIRRVLGLLLVSMFVLTGASAESWYVFSATRQNASLVDIDSRAASPATTITARLMHAGIREEMGMAIIASQFTFEFDCKANRMRTIRFSLVDLDGRVPPNLTSDKVRDWETTDPAENSGRMQTFACDGKLPAKFLGPLDFKDIEMHYLIWLGQPDAGEFTGTEKP